MNERFRTESAPGADERSTHSSAVLEQQEVRRQVCAQCSKPFGLIRRRRAGLQFFSASCMNEQAGGVREAVKAKARWLEFLTQRR